MSRFVLKKTKASIAKRSKKNPMWKDNLVGYSALHEWVKRRKNKPTKCQLCRRKAMDLANISGKYKRDLSDWEWLCRTCHMTRDGRMNLLSIYRQRRMRTNHKIVCDYCGKVKMVIDSQWKKNLHHFCSPSCYFSFRYKR